MVTIKMSMNGNWDMRFDLMVIAGIVAMNCFLAQLLQGVAHLLEDKKSCSFERMFVAGVTPIEFLVSHVTNSVAHMVVYIAEALIFVFLVFDYPLRGSIYLTAALMFFICFEAMAIGTTIG